MVWGGGTCERLKFRRVEGGCVTDGTIEVVGEGDDKSKSSSVVGIDELNSTTTNTTSNVNQPDTTTIMPSPYQYNHNTCTDINVAIVDSGASHHCTPVNIPCTNKKLCVTPYSVSLPDSSVIHATHTA